MALLAKNPMDVILVNTRLFVGLCFGFATTWKLMGGEYGDGTFITSTLLFDGRVRDITCMVGPMTYDQVRTNVSLVELARIAPEHGLAVPIDFPARMVDFALAMSWGTVIGEGSVALAWLLPFKVFSSLRHVLLLGFVLVTYFFLPVVGFASVLAVIGFSWSALKGQHRVSSMYLITLGIVQLYSFKPSSFLFGE
jgi:hypothetical protein